MFNETSFSSPICKWALPLIARQDGDFFPSGTAIIIGQRLAITAKHVIEDFIGRLGTEEIGPKRFKHKFLLQAAQILESGASAVFWNVSKIWRSGLTDIAFLLLEPTVPESHKFHWKNIGIDLRPLKAGEQIHAFGYPTPTISFEHTGKNRIVNWTHEPSTSSGMITQVYHEKRDSNFLKFPCYETNALFKSSMSGGPVFSEYGLCGLVCSGMDFEDRDTDPVGYVVALWPSMATYIDIDRDGHPRGITYPILELARDGFLHAEGWENIRIFNDTCTGKISVFYRLEKMD